MADMDVYNLLVKIDDGYEPTAKESEDLANLRELDLSYTKIAELPESVGKLINLQRLNLSFTQITELPEPVGKLSNLEWLNLSYTKINKLPEIVEKLSNLQWLVLSGTQITELPKFVGELPKLQTLYIESLNLDNLPDSLLTGSLPFWDDYDDEKHNWQGIFLAGTTIKNSPTAVLIQSRELCKSVQAVKVFISYSWDSKEHKQWVRKLSDDLNKAGIETILDVKDMDVGDLIPEFMERSIIGSDFVLVVLTPNYKLKADKRIGGVGDESKIITADIYERHNHRKYKTILAAGTWATSTPTWAIGKLGVDMSSDDVYEESLEQLIESIMSGSPTPTEKRLGNTQIVGGNGMVYNIEDLIGTNLPTVTDRRPPEPIRVEVHNNTPTPTPEPQKEKDWVRNSEGWKNMFPYFALAILAIFIACMVAFNPPWRDQVVDIFSKMKGCGG